MSFQSWQAEFYPADAKEVPIENAIEHSLRKWQGLLQENLVRHELWLWCGTSIHSNSVEDDPDRHYLSVDSNTCALCNHYLYRTNPPCIECPLYAIRGTRCDLPLDSAPEDPSPYHKLTTHADPRPMIDLLTAALDRQRNPPPALIQDGEFIEDGDV